MPNIVEPTTSTSQVPSTVYFRPRSNASLKSIVVARRPNKTDIVATVTLNLYNRNLPATVNFNRPTLRFLPATVTFYNTHASLLAVLNVKSRRNLPATVTFSSGGILRAHVSFNRFGILPASVYIGKRGKASIRAAVFLGTFHKTLLAKVAFRRGLTKDFKATLTIGAPTHTAQ